jgi:hypothetical protein
VADVGQLMHAVDAHLDPGLCEYKPITQPAAVIWNTPDGEEAGWRMGVCDPALEDDPEYLKAGERWKRVCGGIDFDHATADAFMALLEGQEEVKGWKAICGDD